MESLEASVYPGLSAQAVRKSREDFLEMESAPVSEEETTNIASPEGNATELPGGVAIVSAGGVERVVIYPARNGHASYHTPKRCGMYLTYTRRGSRPKGQTLVSPLPGQPRDCHQLACVSLFSY